MVYPSIAWEVNLGIVWHLQSDGLEIELIAVMIVEQDSSRPPEILSHGEAYWEELIGFVDPRSS
jgi:hypothetical protein